MKSFVRLLPSSALPVFVPSPLEIRYADNKIIFLRFAILNWVKISSSNYDGRRKERGGFQSFPRRDHAMTSRPTRSALDHLPRGEGKERMEGGEVFVAD